MDSDSDEYRVVETSVIPEVTSVRVYDSTIEHIRDEHPEVPIELPSLQQAIDNTIQNPTAVEKSYQSSYVFTDETTTNASGDPFRVPVKVVDDTSCRLKTAFFATPSGDREVTWRRDNADGDNAD